jgi:hypothetical protein
MSEAYQEHILNASDVCANCLRVIRVERVDPTREGLTREYESHFERHPRNTEIAYGPADSVSDVKGVFCDRCGTEGAHERIWESADVDDARFEELVKQAIATLKYKGVTLQPQDFAAHALQQRENDATVDEALGAATEAAIVASAARDDADQKERV